MNTIVNSKAGNRKIIAELIDWVKAPEYSEEYDMSMLSFIPYCALIGRVLLLHVVIYGLNYRIRRV
jgi:hypothetical protein